MRWSCGNSSRLLSALGQSWIPAVKLLPSDAASGYMNFGRSTALTDDQLLVGATGAEAVYVFDRDGAWTQVGKLTASDPTPGGKGFGISLSVDGDAAVVGAVGDATFGDRSGAAYVFRRQGGVRGQEAKLVASDGAPISIFGRVVAIEGDVVVVGAPWMDARGDSSGAAYVFRRQGGVWLQEAQPLPDELEAQDYYGSSVVISGDRIIVGSARDDDMGPNYGAAYVYRREGGAWVREAKLHPDMNTITDALGPQFGGAGIALSRDWAIVNSRFEGYFFHREGQAWVRRSKTTFFGSPFLGVAIDGDRAVINLFDFWDSEFRGSAYVMRLVGGEWVQEAHIRKDDLRFPRRFGESAALRGGTLVVGETREVVLPDKYPGAAYVYTLCAADLTGDQIVNFGDYLVFLNFFEAQDPRVDFNRDGIVDFGDYLEFLNFYDAGC